MAEPPKQRESRPGLDPLALILGILAVLVAGYAFTGGAMTLPAGSWRWLLAGIAALVGLGLLLSSLRKRR